MISIKFPGGSTKNAHKFRTDEETGAYHESVFNEAYNYATRNREDFCCGQKVYKIEQFGHFEHDKSAGEIFHADGYLSKCLLCGEERNICYKY